MKKRLFLLLLSLTVLLGLAWQPAAAVPVNMVDQMGGPVASQLSIDKDDILKRYAKTQTYQAIFYPFGEGLLGFEGTATHHQGLNKTDLEIAYSRAIQKSGTDEYSLKTFYDRVAKYEATSKFSDEDMKEMLEDVYSAASIALPAGVTSKMLGSIISAANVVVNTGKLAWDSYQNGMDKESFIAAGFTLGDITGAVGTITDNSQLGAVGGIASSISIARRCFQKHLNDKKEWKAFTDYLVARRNLTEFSKWLDAEIKESMKDATGWELEFPQSQQVMDAGIWGYSAPVTFTFTGRFTQGNVPGEENGYIGNTNAEGWTGHLNLDMVADLSIFQDSLPGSPHDVAGNYRMVMLAKYGNITKDETVFEKFYWNANLNCNHFPLKATNTDTENQSRLQFSGSLTSGNYQYWQGGAYTVDFAAFMEWHEDAGIYRSACSITGGFRISQGGINHSARLYDAIELPEYIEIVNTAFDEMTDEGDIFMYEWAFQHSQADLIIYLDRPKDKK